MFKTSIKRVRKINLNLLNRPKPNLLYLRVIIYLYISIYICFVIKQDFNTLGHFLWQVKFIYLAHFIHKASGCFT